MHFDVELTLYTIFEIRYKIQTEENECNRGSDSIQSGGFLHVLRIPDLSWITTQYYVVQPSPSHAFRGPTRQIYNHLPPPAHQVRSRRVGSPHRQSHLHDVHGCQSGLPKCSP